MIPAPKGLYALFDIGGDKKTAMVKVIAFDDRGTAMVLNMDRGRLSAIDIQPNFLCLIWDEAGEA